MSKKPNNLFSIFDNTIAHHPSRTDTPLSISNVNGTFYYHEHPEGISSFQSGHHQGSIVALSNEEGEIVEEISYDGHYGEIIKGTSNNR